MTSGRMECICKRVVVVVPSKLSAALLAIRMNTTYTFHNLQGTKIEIRGGLTPIPEELQCQFLRNCNADLLAIVISKELIIFDESWFTLPLFRQSSHL